MSAVTRLSLQTEKNYKRRPQDCRHHHGWRLDADSGHHQGDRGFPQHKKCHDPQEQQLLRVVRLNPGSVHSATRIWPASVRDERLRETCPEPRRSHRKSAKEHQLNDVALAFILKCEPVQGFVQICHILRSARSNNQRFIQGYSLRLRLAFARFLVFAYSTSARRTTRAAMSVKMGPDLPCDVRVDRPTS
jgi:hypothetical protein